MVGGRLVGGSVVTDLMKPRKKHLWSSDYSPVQFGGGLFCYSNFIFFYIDDKEKTNLIARSNHSNL